MSSILEDIFSTTKTYLEAQNLGASGGVLVGFPDERADVPENPSYPIVALNLYDVIFDPVRRVGGYVKKEVSINSTDLELRPLPIPVNYHFQLDVVCDNRRQSWDINQKLMVIFGRRWSKLTLPNTQAIYLVPEDVIPLLGVEGLSIHRTTYSYYVQSWIEDTAAVTVVKKILSLNISYGEDQLSNVEVQ